MMAYTDDLPLNRRRGVPSLGSGAAETLLVLVTTGSTLVMAGNSPSRPGLAAGAFIGVILGVAATIAFLNYRRVRVTTVGGPDHLSNAQASLALGLLLTSAAIGWWAVMVSPPTAVLVIVVISFRVFHDSVLRNQPRLRGLSFGVALAFPVLVCWTAVEGSPEIPAVCLIVLLVLWVAFHQRLSSVPSARMQGKTASPNAPRLVFPVCGVIVCSFLLLAVTGAGWIRAATLLVANIALLIASQAPRRRDNARASSLLVARCTSLAYPFVIFGSAAVNAIFD